jgi:uncharacterized protein involved in exopolysaccharide biosynthesis
MITRIEPTDILDAIVFRWRLIVLGILVGGATGAVVAQLYRPPAEVTAKVMIQDNAAVNPFLEDMMVDWSVKNRLPVTQHIIESRQLSIQTLETLGIIDEHTSPDAIDSHIAALQQRLDMYSLGQGVVKIKYRGENPEAALDGLNVVIELFVAEMLRPQKEALDKSVDFLGKEVERVRGELDDLEEQLRVYKQEHADELPEVFAANLNAYLKLLEARDQAHADLAAEQVRAQVSKRRLKKYNPATRALEAKLVDARHELATLRASFQDKHPRVRAARARLEELEASYGNATLQDGSGASLGQLESLADRLPIRDTDSDIGKPRSLLLGQLMDHQQSESTARALEVKLDRIQTNIDEAMERINGHAANEKFIQQLERDIETRALVYQRLLRRHQEAQVTRHLVLNEEEGRVWIIDRPTRPSPPPRISTPLGIAGGMAGSIGLTLALILVLEFLSSGIRFETDIDPDSHVAVFGRLPWTER